MLPLNQLWSDSVLIHKWTIQYLTTPLNQWFNSVFKIPVKLLLFDMIHKTMIQYLTVPVYLWHKIWCDYFDSKDNDSLTLPLNRIQCNMMQFSILWLIRVQLGSESGVQSRRDGMFFWIWMNLVRFRSRTTLHALQFVYLFGRGFYSKCFTMITSERNLSGSVGCKCKSPSRCLVFEKWFRCSNTQLLYLYWNFSG